MRPTISTANFPTLRRARFAETEAAEHAREERLLAERKAALECARRGIDHGVLVPVAIVYEARESLVVL